MRKLILAVPIVAALAALAVPSLASAAAAPANITIPAGQTVDLSWQTIPGNVEVYGTLLNYGKTHYEGNVTVHPGGTFQADNWGVTIDKNLTFLNPSGQSGFWPTSSDPSGTPSEVKGNVTFTVDGTVPYSCYAWPSLYVHGLKVDKNFAYTGYTFNSHLDADLSGVVGQTSITSVAPQDGC
jgi:hypothetical protein